MMCRAEVVIRHIVRVVGAFLSDRFDVEVLSVVWISHGNVSTWTWFTTAHDIILDRRRFAVVAGGKEALKRCVWLTLQFGGCHILD